MNDFWQGRLFYLLIAALGTILPGCSDEVAVGKSNTSGAAFGPTLVINAKASGFSAENMAALIAAPIEKQLAALETLPLVESICTEGQVEFLLHTKIGCNLKQVESLISDRLASLKDSLPQALQDSGLQLQTKTAPHFVVAVYSPEGVHDNVYLSNYVKLGLREQLAHVPGVGEVTVLGPSPAGDEVTVKEHPGIALLLAPTVDAKPTEIATALTQRLAELRAELPAGILLTLPINTTNLTDPRETLLLLEMKLPPGVDASQRSLELREASSRLRDLPGIKNWVGFTRHPLEGGNANPCIVLHAAASEPDQAQKKVGAAIQTLFAAKNGIRVRLKSFGKPDAATIRAAVSGPDVVVADDLANKLVDKLHESRSFMAEQRRGPLEVKPRIALKLDRSKLAAHGVTSAEIASALEKTLGVPPHQDTAREQINLPETPQSMNRSALEACVVKNAQGNEIRLSDLALIEAVPAKVVVYRVNNQPAVLLATQSLGQQTQKEAREQIGALFAATRGSVTQGDEYKLTWLED